MDIIIIVICTQYIITNDIFMCSHYVSLFLEVIDIMQMVVYPT